MKNYNELSNLETLLIKFQSFSSALQVITNGIESSNVNDITGTMYHITEVVDTFNSDIRNAFDAVWEASKEVTPSHVGSSYPYRDSSKSLDDTYDEISRFDLSKHSI